MMFPRVHGAHQLLSQIGPNMLVLVDAGITSAGFFEHVRTQRAHVLGALQAGAWEHLPTQRRLADGSRLCWVPPTRNVQYPSQRGMWVRIISYRVTDERVAGSGQGISLGHHPAQSTAGSGSGAHRTLS
jgi:hypothetical protein